MKKRKEKRNEKIAVAMSGGVDSSVAAALLKKQGHDVIGVFMKLWVAPEDKKKGQFNGRCSSESETRARKVAKILNIPFYVFNFEKEFKKKIVDYFLDGYKKGITPNPCVVCNKEIKFGLLLEKALRIEADFIATGHYARLRREIRNSNIKIIKYRCKLLKGRDKEKDQSYFLWQLNQKKLEKVFFPIGDYTRSEVEKMAKKFKLPFSGVKKSQEVCFIKNTVEEFLKNCLKEKPGLIKDSEGKTLGRHQGLHFYTIGQRKGIGLPLGPYYATEKDLKNNFLIVTKNKKNLHKKELNIKNVNWIFGKEPDLPLRISAKIRYRHKPARAELSRASEKKGIPNFRLIFDKPQRAMTPGQSAVFYKGKQVLGGGVIF